MTTHPMSFRAVVAYSYIGSFMIENAARQRNNGTRGLLMHREIDSNRLQTKPDMEKRRGERRTKKTLYRLLTGLTW
jgi:hypothetical protein